MTLLPSQDINPSVNPSRMVVGERFGKDARDRYACQAKSSHFGFGTSRK